MKKLLAIFAAVTALSAQANETLTVAASAVPHAEILEFVKPTLAKEGVDLNIKVFNDYIQPNVQVSQNRMDANFFQHQPYLDEFNKGKGTDLVAVAKVHIEPFGAYSDKLKTLADLPNGANVALPNDATNEGRALLLLAKAGLITLKDPGNILSKPSDVVNNPKDLKFRELEAASAAPRADSGRSGADQHQLRFERQARSDQGRADHRRCRFALREHSGGPPGQQGLGRDEEAGSRLAEPGSENVPGREVQRRCGSGVLI
ncbi:ABC-type metal ion transport system substrate-binding protein [Pseudomonas sp. PvP046]